MTTSPGRIAIAHLDSGVAPYAQTIHIGRHAVISDEPTASGGGDQGPAPYGLLLASLAACTAMTLRMYAERKGWELGAVHIDLTMTRDGDAERIARTIKLDAALAPEQRARLAEIADRTPVTRTLKRAMAIDTTLA